MNAYTDIITELTLEIVRLREVIDNLIKQKDSLQEKLSLAENELGIEKTKHSVLGQQIIHSNPSSGIRTTAESIVDAIKRNSQGAEKYTGNMHDKVLAVFSDHPKQVMDAPMVQQKLELPEKQKNSVHTVMCKLCTKGHLQRTRPGLYKLAK